MTFQRAAADAVNPQKDIGFLGPQSPLCPSRRGWWGMLHPQDSARGAILLPLPSTTTSGWGWASAWAGRLPCWGQRTTLCLLWEVPLATMALLCRIDSVSFLLNWLKEFPGLHDIFVASCRSLASPSSSPSGDTIAASQLSCPSCNRQTCMQDRKGHD